MIFINQIRMKIGVMFGSPETTTGGNALKFYASVRLDIRRIGSVKDRDEIVGNNVRVKVVKNKVAPPFREVEFDIIYGQGISKLGEIIDLGVKAGVVEKSGSWFSFDSERIGQGRDNVREFLKANPDVAAEIEQAVRAPASRSRRSCWSAPPRPPRGRRSAPEPRLRAAVPPRLQGRWSGPANHVARGRAGAGVPATGQPLAYLASSARTGRRQDQSSGP